MTDTTTSIVVVALQVEPALLSPFRFWLALGSAAKGDSLILVGWQVH